MKENFTSDVFGSQTEVIQAQGPVGHMQYKATYDISRKGIIYKIERNFYLESNTYVHTFTLCQEVLD